MLARAAVVITVTVALAVASFAAWTYRADIGHAASRIGAPPAASTTDATNSSSPPGTVDDGPTLGIAEQPAPPLLTPGPVNVKVPDFLSWALLDRQANAISGSANYASTTSSTASMIKTWISADYLRLLGNVRPDDDRLTEISQMIRDSDNDAAEDIYDLDGQDAVVQRMINICGLTETSIAEGWWSRTQMSARDAVRLGACVADGRAAGTRWTTWLLNEMRQVRGDGRFGIVEALPAYAAARTSIKNGWSIVDDDWHVACLAIVDRYVLAVLTRYPAELGLRYGAEVCRNVATQLQPRG